MSLHNDLFNMEKKFKATMCLFLNQHPAIINKNDSKVDGTLLNTLFSI